MIEPVGRSRRPMTVCRRFMPGFIGAGSLLLLFALLPCTAAAQPWTKPTLVYSSPRLFTQWRKDGTDPSGSRNAMEWLFVNLSDSLCEFDYLVVSNRNEKQVGRMTLPSRSRRFSGWYLAGDSIVDIRIGRLKITGSR